MIPHHTPEERWRDLNLRPRDFSLFWHDPQNKTFDLKVLFKNLGTHQRSHANLKGATQVHASRQKESETVQSKREDRGAPQTNSRKLRTKANRHANRETVCKGTETCVDEDGCHKKNAQNQSK